MQKHLLGFSSIRVIRMIRGSLFFLGPARSIAWLYFLILCLAGQILQAAEAAVPTWPAFPTWAERIESPNHSERHSDKITAIIYHYTAGGSLDGSVKEFQKTASKVSAHYVIGHDGKVVQMVPLDLAAWHAGESVLAGKEHVNDFSIGIEIVNFGKLTKRGDKFYNWTKVPYEGPTPLHAEGAYWEPFTDKQYESLVRLTKELIEKYPIDHITGHSHIALPIGRTTDPGAGFDWKRVQKELPKSYTGQFGPIKR